MNRRRTSRFRLSCVWRQLPHSQPNVLEDYTFQEPAPNVLCQWCVIRSVIGRIDYADLVYRHKVSCTQMGDFHPKHADNGAIKIRKGRQSSQCAVATIETFIAKICFPPSRECPIGVDLPI